MNTKAKRNIIFWLGISHQGSWKTIETTIRDLIDVFGSTTLTVNQTFVRKSRIETSTCLGASYSNFICQSCLFRFSPNNAKMNIYRTQCLKFKTLTWQTNKKLHDADIHLFSPRFEKSALFERRKNKQLLAKVSNEANIGHSHYIVRFFDDVKNASFAKDKCTKHETVLLRKFCFQSECGNRFHVFGRDEEMQEKLDEIHEWVMRQKALEIWLGIASVVSVLGVIYSVCNSCRKWCRDEEEKRRKYNDGYDRLIWRT